MGLREIFLPLAVIVTGALQGGCKSGPETKDDEPDRPAATRVLKRCQEIRDELRAILLDPERHTPEDARLVDKLVAECNAVDDKTMQEILDQIRARNSTAVAKKPQPPEKRILPSSCASMLEDLDNAPNVCGVPDIRAFIKQCGIQPHPAEIGGKWNGRLTLLKSDGYRDGKNGSGALEASCEHFRDIDGWYLQTIRRRLNGATHEKMQWDITENPTAKFGKHRTKKFITHGAIYPDDFEPITNCTDDKLRELFKDNPLCELPQPTPEEACEAIMRNPPRICGVPDIPKIIKKCGVPKVEPDTFAHMYNPHLLATNDPKEIIYLGCVGCPVIASPAFKAGKTGGVAYRVDCYAPGFIYDYERPWYEALTQWFKRTFASKKDRQRSLQIERWQVFNNAQGSGPCDTGRSCPQEQWRRVHEYYDNFTYDSDYDWEKGRGGSLGYEKTEYKTCKPGELEQLFINNPICPSTE